MRTLVLVTLLALAACSGSKEDQLIEARREQRGLLDKLYADYGGGALAAEVKAETKKGEQQAAQEPKQDGAQAAIEFLKTVGNAAGEFDRAAFEVQCETLGNGGRPVILNDKAKAYFAQKSVETRCLEVAKVSRKIEGLERELGDRAPRP
jgi:hypothetical protein